MVVLDLMTETTYNKLEMERRLALRHKYHFYITDIKRRNVFYIDAIYTY